MNNDFYSSDYQDTNSKANTISSITTMTFIKAYLWMFIAALMTFLMGLVCAKWLKTLIMNTSSDGLVFFYVLTFISFFVQLILCYRINKNSLVNANFKKSMIQLMIFALLNGFTFSTLFIYFHSDFLYQVFGIVTLYYLLLSGLTYLFKNKIHKAANFAYVGLITLLIVSGLTAIYSIFILSSMLFLVVSLLGLIVFTIITMVDIRHMYSLIDQSSNPKCAAVAAAFTLYLDFINIFMYVLRIVAILGGKRKS